MSLNSPSRQPPLQPQMAWSIGLLLIAWILATGIVLDQQQNISLSSMSYSYSFAVVIGVLVIAIPTLLRSKNWVVTTMIIMATVVVLRISFFPIVVIAGYLTTVSENILLAFVAQPVIYPVLLFSAALLHAFSTYIAIVVIRHSISRLKKTLILVAALPLVLLASVVSFIHPNDFQILAFSINGNEPLSGETSMPRNNPYRNLLKLGGHSWQETTLFYAGLITYELIPSRGVWTQYTKGTLEQDLRNSKNISSRYFTISHLNAFWLAGK